MTIGFKIPNNHHESSAIVIYKTNCFYMFLVKTLLNCMYFAMVLYTLDTNVRLCLVEMKLFLFSLPTKTRNGHIIDHNWLQINHKNIYL